MVFTSVADLTAALAGIATISGDQIAVTAAPSTDLVDRLAHTAVFGATPELKGTARWVILHLAAHQGIRFASIHDLYIAMGKGEAGGFTVPAINVRMMAYDTGRAVMRAAKGLDAGAFILEIARSEIGYTAVSYTHLRACCRGPPPATKRPRRDCCRSCTTSCGGWRVATCGASVPVRRCRPRPSCTKPTCGS